MKRKVLGEEIENISSGKGNRFKLFWNRITKKIWISLNIEGPHYGHLASNREGGIEIARKEIEKITKEDPDAIKNPKFTRYKNLY